MKIKTYNFVDPDHDKLTDRIAGVIELLAKEDPPHKIVAVTIAPHSVQVVPVHGSVFFYIGTIFYESNE